MKKLLISGIALAFLIACGEQSPEAPVEEKPTIISEEEAIETAITEVGGEAEVIGIRFDKEDNQWDVFVKSNDKNFEVEIDATNGNILTSEEESLPEIHSELSGDLSHEEVEYDIDE